MCFRISSNKSYFWHEYVVSCYVNIASRNTDITFDWFIEKYIDKKILEKCPSYYNKAHLASRNGKKYSH